MVNTAQISCDLCYISLFIKTGKIVQRKNYIIMNPFERIVTYIILIGLIKFQLSNQISLDLSNEIGEVDNLISYTGMIRSNMVNKIDTSGFKQHV